MAERVWKVLESRNLELGPFTDPSPQAGEGMGGGGGQEAHKEAGKDIGQDAGQWRHWKLRRDEDDILWLVFDKSGASANTLSQDVLAEFDDVLGKIEKESARGWCCARASRPDSSPVRTWASCATTKMQPTSRRA